MGWSLHKPHECRHFCEMLDWGYTDCSILNPSYRDQPNGSRAVAHAFFVCKKRVNPAVPVDDTEMPALLGALTPEAHTELLADQARRAQEEAIAAASVENMSGALDKALSTALGSESSSAEEEA